MLRESSRHRHASLVGARGVERRGATIVIVAIVMVVLFGFTAFAIDFGRAYLSQAQLQTGADAAALAGAYELMNETDFGEDSAVAMAVRNKVQAVSPNVVSVEAGFWDDDARTFTPATWTTPGVNAVRAVTGHQMGYTFARVMGFTNIDLTKPAVAAVGSATFAQCVKPWGIPFQVLAYAAGRPDWATNNSDLTAAEIENLINNRIELQFKLGSKNDESGTFYDVNNNVHIPGNFRALALDGNGANVYRDAIAGTNCSGSIRVDATVMTEPGNMVGPTEQGVSLLCLGHQGASSGTCPPPNNQVLLPIWDDPGSGNGRVPAKVRYVGAFEISRWGCEQPSCKGPNEAKGSVYGYITAFDHVNAGGFQVKPGLAAVTALVQ